MTVLVVGNATVDISFEVEYLPRAGETLLASGRLVDAGGKGLNQAVMAHRAGAATAYVAPVGTDPEASVIRARLVAEGISDQGLVVGSGPTDQSIIWVDRAGENAIVSTAERARGLAAEAAFPAIDRLGPEDILLMQGNLTRQTTQACLARARARGATTILNPAPIDYAYDDIWPFVSLSVLNQVESATLSREPEPAAAMKRLRALGVDSVVVTLGPEGAIWSNGVSRGSAPAPKVSAVDTTGAGDVFCGVLASLLARRRPLADAVAAGVAAASLSVTRRGVTSSFPREDELNAMVDRDE